MRTQDDDALASTAARQVTVKMLGAVFGGPDACASLRSADALDLLEPAFAQAALGVGAITGGLGADAASTIAALARLSPVRRARVDQEVLGLVAGRKCPPIETEWLPWKDTTHRAQHLADAAGFYRAFGVDLAKERATRADHLTVQFDFVALLLEKRVRTFGDTDGGPHRAVLDSTLALFLGDHVLWWVPRYAQRLAELAGQFAETATDAELAEDARLLERAARVLERWCLVERAWTAAEPAHTPTDPKPDDEANTETTCGGCSLNES